MRRVLALLDPASDLERVVMEDLTPVPPEGVDASLLLGADLTEYYGGTEIRTAHKVVVSQLKYSHRNPIRAWTAARLATAAAPGKASVISRLSDLFTGLMKMATREEALARLEIRLVSNMPSANVLREAVDAAHAWLALRDGARPARIAARGAH